MKTKRFLIICFFLLFFTFGFKNYSYSFNEVYLRKNVDLFSYNNSNTIMKFVNENKSPVIISKLEKNLSELEYEVTLFDYNKDAYNYLVFYNVDNENFEEIFRVRVYNSGKDKIKDEKVLKLFDNNTAYKVVLETFYIKDNEVVNKKYSNFSKIYFTPREYKLEILEDDKVVYNENIVDNSFIENNNIFISLANLKKYEPDYKYYNYDNCKIFIDNNEFDGKNDILKTHYKINEVKIQLSKNMNNWKVVNFKYPSNLNDFNEKVFVKKNTNFKDFLEENKNVLKNIKKENYIFKGYFVNNTNINDYKENISDDTTINAIFDTKIVIDNKIKREILYLPTGYDLGKIDLTNYLKKDYTIENYTIIDNHNKKKKEVKSLNNIFIDESITIIPNYKIKTNKIKLRQDEYNSRFGTVADEIKNKDFDVPVNEKTSDFLQKLENKIVANKGYETKFRINKKIVEDNENFKEDTILEIYFKKVDSDWITVKFLGEGVDKFLSDGQEVLVGDKLNNINLPTTSGSSKEISGWIANRNIYIEKNGKLLEKSKDNILKLTDFSNIVARKNENLIFNIEYVKEYTISIENKGSGEILVSNNENNIFISKENEDIKTALSKNKLIFNPKSHHKFSYLTSTLPVLVNKGNGNFKIIEIGEKISLLDFYNIVPKSNLTFYSHFVFSNSILDDRDNFLEDYTMNIFNFEKNTKEENLKSILGPFTYLL